MAEKNLLAAGLSKMLIDVWESINKKIGVLVACIILLFIIHTYRPQLYNLYDRLFCFILLVQSSQNTEIFVT